MFLAKSKADRCALRLFSAAVMVGLASTSIYAQAAPEADAAQAQAQAEASQTGQSQATETSQAPTKLQEVTVTASRREQTEITVPVSISAYTTETLNRRNITDITDIARQTPGVTFSKAMGTTASTSQISIRGISSSVGAATTGIYINDTPVQVRTAGYTSSNVYPIIFDLARVEVLRGPQGTLFGSGSEGGTIRFITPTPNLSHYSVYAKGGMATTENGGLSANSGIAVGGPIVQGKLGFRGSVYTSHTGGYIDRVNFQTGQMRQKDANYNDSTAAMLSLLWEPGERWSITPSLYYQYINRNNLGGWWEQLSDPSAKKYASGNLLPGPDRDRMILPALKIQYFGDNFTIINNLSYMHRDGNADNDYSEFISRLATVGTPGNPPGGNPYATAENYSNGYFLQSQHFLTEELRLQSADPGASLQWVVGAFYQRNRQRDEELVSTPNFPDMFFAAHGMNYVDYYGAPLGPNNSVYTDIESTIDKQVALFGQADYTLFDKLTITLGARVAKVDFSFKSENAGSFSGFGTNAGSESKTVVTPKLGLKYQATPDNMIYANAAKGFRPGGAQRQPPSPCDSDLRALGINKTPSSYEPDHVWSYELGTKNMMFRQRVSVSASAFYVKWSNIQQSVNLPVCGQNLILNLGSATSKGVDLALQAQASRHVQFNLAAGYTHATADRTITTPGAVHPLIVEGESIGGPGFAPWHVSVGAEYDHSITGDYRGFIRADYQYIGQGPEPEPALVGYDPTLPRSASYNNVNIRGGIRWPHWEISLFANNLFNNHTEIQRSRQGTSALYQGFSLRPRTIGFRVIYRRD